MAKRKTQTLELNEMFYDGFLKMNQLQSPHMQQQRNLTPKDTSLISKAFTDGLPREKKL
jgi:hypothetical protein